MEIVTKAKCNCNAFEKPAPRKSGRGRPAQKGKTIHLKDLFESHKEQFMETEMVFYGKKEKVRYYSFRFRIEYTFRELKQQTGAFCYHFWSKHMPRLNYYRKETEPSALTQVESSHARRKIMQAVRAIEMHMALSCIAMGTIQCLSLRMEGKLCSEQIRYQRTPSKGKVP